MTAVLQVCGPTGTGKSAYMRRLLLKQLPRDKFAPVFLAFSAQTSARQTQVRCARMYGLLCCSHPLHLYSPLVL
jgi:hypothetical protein